MLEMWAKGRNQLNDPSKEDDCFADASDYKCSNFEQNFNCWRNMAGQAASMEGNLQIVILLVSHANKVMFWSAVQQLEPALML